MDEVAFELTLPDVRHLLQLCWAINGEVGELTDSHGGEIGGTPNPTFIRRLVELADELSRRH